jgi:hypothetical protein
VPFANVVMVFVARSAAAAAAHANNHPNSGLGKANKMGRLLRIYAQYTNVKGIANNIAKGTNPNHCS